MSEPSLTLGDDPVLLLNIDDPARCGSYSQIATTGAKPVSLWLPWAETVERALAAMRSNHLVIMPLGPQRLLTLSRSALMKPGRYDIPAAQARAYNVMMAAASRRWICSTPADGASKPRAAAAACAAEFRRAVMGAEAPRRRRVSNAA